MRYLILFYLLLVVTANLNAQTVRVINAETKEPVENVLVISKKYTAQTNADGLVHLKNTGKNEPLLFQHSSFLKLKTTLEKIEAVGNLVELTETPLNIDEVVISASRWEQSKAEIPFKIEQIGLTDILQNQPQTAADLLGSTSGVFIQKSQMGGGSPMIRGFSANRLLLVVDGIRMNNAIYRSGNLHNVVALDAGSIQQAEVIFGPGSVIFGSDALGGVMSFTTLLPRLSTSEKTEQKGRIFSRYSTVNQEKMVHGDISIGNKKWAGLFSATYTDFDDLRMGSHGPDEYLRPDYVVPGKKPEEDAVIKNENPRMQKPVGYSQLNLMAKIRYRPSSHFDFLLGVHHSQSSDIPRYDRLVVYRNDALQYAGWYYSPQKWSLVSGKLDYRKKHLFFDRFNLLSGFQNYAEGRNDRKLYDAILYQRKEDLLIYSLNLDFAKNLNGKHDLFYGTEFLFNKVKSSGTALNIADGQSEQIASRYPDGSEYGSLAGYLSWKYSLSNRLSLQAGARFTHTRLSGLFDNRFFAFPFEGFNLKNSALNGNAGIVWHPANAWQINFTASTGFRSPNIDDVAKVFDSEPGNVVVPNPGLKPEFARNVETGVNYHSDKWKLELSAFYTNLKDAMVRRNFQLNGRDSIVYDGILSEVEALVNAQSANIYGGSIRSDYKFTSVLSSESELTYAWGKDSDGLPMRHVPPVFGRSHLKFENESFQLNFFVVFSGKFDFEQLAPDEQDKPHLYAIDKNGNPWSPAWWTLNLKGNYQFSQVVNFSGGVENILDKRYRSYSSGIVAPGRNFFLSIGFHF